MKAFAAALVLSNLGACTSWGTYEGTRAVSMWERSAPGAPGPADARTLSD